MVSYVAIAKKLWCRLEDLNPQPTDYKSVALPIELNRHINEIILSCTRWIVNVILTSESLSKKLLGQYVVDQSGSLFVRALPIELNRHIYHHVMLILYS